MAKDFTKPILYSTKRVNNPLQDEEAKPSESVLQDNFTPEKYELYRFLKSEIQKFEKVDLFWRGNDNGWVLATKSGKGMHGFVILKEGELKGGINEFTISRNFVEERKPIKTRQDALEFVELVKVRSGHFQQITI